MPLAPSPGPIDEDARHEPKIVDVPPGGCNPIGQQGVSLADLLLEVPIQIFEEGIDDWANAGVCPRSTIAGWSRLVVPECSVHYPSSMWRALLLSIAACAYDPSVGTPRDSQDSGDTPKDAAFDGNPVDTAADASGNAVTCPGAMCGPFCCDGTCANPIIGTCVGKLYECDGPEDCTGTEVCCNAQNGSACTPSGMCTTGNSPHEVCHAPADCSNTSCSCTFEGTYGQKVCCE